MKQRLDYIDRTRGILIILVVIGHIWQSGYVHNFIYVFHMPAFFAISGILLYHTKSYNKSFKDFALSRLYSFGIPFVFIETLGCLTDLMRHGYNLNIKGYMYNTLTLNFNDPNLWFLLTLFVVELVFVALLKTLKKDLFVIVAEIALLCVYFALPTGSKILSTVKNTLYFSIFFTCGFFFFKAIEKSRKPMLLLSWFAVLMLSVVFGKKSNSDFSVANIMFLIGSFLGTYAILQTGKKPLPEKLDRWIAGAGKNTILIYGTHRLYYSIVGVLLGISDYGSTPIGAGVIMLLAVTVLEIPTIYIINRWLPFLAGKHYKRKVKTV